MAAERTLRIVDALAIRAPNAEMPFLEGKVRCQVNHTLEWLSNKPLDEQKNLIDFATSFEKKARKEVKLKKMALASRINAKQRKKVHERDVTCCYINQDGVLIRSLPPGSQPYPNLLLSPYGQKRCQRLHCDLPHSACR